MRLEPTKRGGFRRTGVAQKQSADVTRQRSEARTLPPVLVKLNEKLGLPTCPYLIRWRIETRWGSIRLHHWLASDDQRNFHDHPWDFITLVIRGGYVDRSPSGDEHLKAGRLAFRSSEHQHTVYPDPGGAWTLVFTGPKVRNWGFWVAGRFKKANKYFLTYGHHPCN
jgi:hypothetical protein